MIRLMRAAGIHGWKRGLAIAGRPDFVFKRERVAVFIDGCFWHGCKCKRLSKTHRSFWRAKTQANKKRDHRITRRLRSEGWNVIRFWEHQLKRNPKRVAVRVTEALEKLGRIRPKGEL